MDKHLNLFVPEWQGYGVDNSPGEGARALRESLFPQVEFLEIPIQDHEELESMHGIIGYSSVLQTMRRLHDAVSSNHPSSLFTLGGTCGIEVVPVTWLNKYCSGDLAVVWLDAHGDLNTPESSPSGHFHGMPVRTILGEGHSDLCELAFSVLEPRQVFQVGVRDLDPPEAEFVESAGIKLYPVDLNVDNLLDDISSRGFRNVYIHFDLDVLEPAEFTDMIFHVRAGMSLPKALQVVTELRERLTVVGSSLLEFVSRGGQHLKFLQDLSQKLATR